MPSKRLDDWSVSVEPGNWVLGQRFTMSLPPQPGPLLTLHSYHKPFYLLAWRRYNVHKVNMRADGRDAFKPPSQILLPQGWWSGWPGSYVNDKILLNLWHNRPGLSCRTVPPKVRLLPLLTEVCRHWACERALQGANNTIQGQSIGLWIGLTLNTASQPASNSYYRKRIRKSDKNLAAIVSVSIMIMRKLQLRLIWQQSQLSGLPGPQKVKLVQKRMR